MRHAPMRAHTSHVAFVRHITHDAAAHTHIRKEVSIMAAKKRKAAPKKRAAKKPAKRKAAKRRR